MTAPGPRIVLIGGTYRALCLLESLLDRGERMVAFIGQEDDSKRDFCSEILELCDRTGVPARSARKFGEEIVRWLEDRIRPDLVISVGVNTEIPLAIGGNARLGLIELVDFFSSDSCPGVEVRQRGQSILSRSLSQPDDDDEAADVYLRMIDEMLGLVDQYLDQLQAPLATTNVAVPYLSIPNQTEDHAELWGCPEPGPETDRLEAEVAAYLGADRVIALRSQLDALTLVFESLELGADAEVICPGIVSASTLEALKRSGAKPILADVDPKRLTLDPERVKELLTTNTRAMVIGHPFGQPAALDALYAIAEARDIEVIEDAGGSLGARYQNSRLGRSPCTCVFRMPLFYTSTSTHAVLVTAPDLLADRLESKARALRLGNGAGARACQILAGWEDRLAARRENARIYSSELIRYDAFQVPHTPEEALPVYAGYLLRVTRFARTTADDLHKLLGESGIKTRRISLPLVERDLIRLPTTEAVRVDAILLPIEAGLTTHQLERVLDAIFGFAIG